MEDAVSNVALLCTILKMFFTKNFDRLASTPNLKLDFSSYCFQHETILDLDGARTTSFFGVYDGHGGLFFFLLLLQHTEAF